MIESLLGSYLMIVFYTTALIEKFEIKYGLSISIIISSIFVLLLVYLNNTISELKEIILLIYTILGVLAILSGVLLVSKVVPSIKAWIIGDVTYNEIIINSDLRDIKSKNFGKKIYALKHLEELGKGCSETELHTIYYGLCDALTREKDHVLKDQIIELICKFYQKKGNFQISMQQPSNNNNNSNN